MKSRKPNEFDITIAIDEHGCAAVIFSAFVLLALEWRGGRNGMVLFLRG